MQEEASHQESDNIKIYIYKDIYKDIYKEIDLSRVKYKVDCFISIFMHPLRFFKKILKKVHSYGGKLVLRTSSKIILNFRHLLKMHI